MKSVYGNAVTTAAALLISIDLCAAAGPERVPRIMMIWRSSQPLDWESPESVAFVAMPLQTQTDADSLSVAIVEDPALEATLLANLPDLTNEELDALSETVLLALGDTDFLTHPVRHVRTGGGELFDGTDGLIYWDASPPPTGAMAQSGPAGDVLVLGEFHFRQNNGTYPLPSWTYIMVDDPDAPVHAQLAIGWFTK